MQQEQESRYKEWILPTIGTILIFWLIKIFFEWYNTLNQKRKRIFKIRFIIIFSLVFICHFSYQYYQNYKYESYFKNTTEEQRTPEYTYKQLLQTIEKYGENSPEAKYAQERNNQSLKNKLNEDHF